MEKGHAVEASRGEDRVDRLVRRIVRVIDEAILRDGVLPSDVMAALGEVAGRVVRQTDAPAIVMQALLFALVAPAVVAAVERMEGPVPGCSVH